MNPTSIAGILLGLGALLFGQLLEGGHLAAVFQLAAGVIVLGGTLGATLLSVPGCDLRRSMRLLPAAFLRQLDPRPGLVARFFELAVRARKDGIVSLEPIRAQLPDPFLQRAVAYVVDGLAQADLQAILESDLDQRFAADEAAVRVFEIAGGYAPTMGILGAVLGLVHAMESLSSPEDLGRGIAVAFVATIYGVGFANLALLPIAAKLERVLDHRRSCEELIVEGAMALQAGHAPQLIRARLRSRLSDTTSTSVGQTPT